MKAPRNAMPNAERFLDVADPYFVQCAWYRCRREAVANGLCAKHYVRSRVEWLTAARQDLLMAKRAHHGFAAMDRAKQREIASQGGQAAHAHGTAHEWTSEEARIAGRKGGLARHRRVRAIVPVPPPTPDPITPE